MEDESVYCTNDFLTSIDERETVDAEPVRKGKWVCTKKKNICGYNVVVFECSECKEFITADKFCTGKYKYCPQCGAKMDKEVDL